MFSGDTRPSRIGPPQPAPQTSASLVRTASTACVTAAQTASGSAVVGVGTSSRTNRRPESSTNPAATLVPPMSTARATPMIEQPNVAPMSRTQPAEPTEAFASTFTAIVENVERVIQGKVDVIQLALLCMLSEEIGRASCRDREYVVG